MRLQLTHGLRVLVLVVTAYAPTHAFEQSNREFPDQKRTTIDQELSVYLELSGRP